MMWKGSEDGAADGEWHPWAPRPWLNRLTWGPGYKISNWVPNFVARELANLYREVGPITQL